MSMGSSSGTRGRSAQSKSSQMDSSIEGSLMRALPRRTARSPANTNPRTEAAKRRAGCSRGEPRSHDGIARRARRPGPVL